MGSILFVSWMHKVSCIFANCLAASQYQPVLETAATCHWVRNIWSTLVSRYHGGLLQSTARSVEESIQRTLMSIFVWAGVYNMWMFSCLCESCFTRRWYSNSETNVILLTHTLRAVLNMSHHRRFSMADEGLVWLWERFRMCSQKKESTEILSRCDHPACFSYIAEHFNTEVISWHLKKCPERMDLGMCSVCCHSTI